MPVECLPADVACCDLPTRPTPVDDTLLPIGLRFGDGQVCIVDVPDGEHLLIIGPPRSGRSTALQRMVRAWVDVLSGRLVATSSRRAARPSTDLNRRRSLDEILDDIPPTGRVLIAIDDAEMVDDVGGALAVTGGVATARV